MGVWATRSKPEDTFILFFSGHGIPEPMWQKYNIPDSPNVYLLTYDSHSDSPYASAISIKHFDEALSRIPAERIFVFLDACYSGSLSEGGKGIRLGGAKSYTQLSPEFYETVLKSKGRFIMAAARVSEEAFELNELNHGVFSNYLHESITTHDVDMDSDGKLSLKEIFDYVQPRVTEKVKKRKKRTQTPVLVTPEDYPPSGAFLIEVN